LAKLWLSKNLQKQLHFSKFNFEYRFLAKYIIASPPIKGPIPRVCRLQPEATSTSIDKSSSLPPSLLFRQKKDRDIERREKRERGVVGILKGGGGAGGGHGEMGAVFCFRGLSRNLLVAACSYENKEARGWGQ
jgi:hypothetical protein